MIKKIFLHWFQQNLEKIVVMVLNAIQNRLYKYVNSANEEGIPTENDQFVECLALSVVGAHRKMILALSNPEDVLVSSDEKGDEA